MKPSVRLFTLLGIWTALGLALACFNWFQLPSILVPYGAPLLVLWKGFGAAIFILCIIDTLLYFKGPPLSAHRTVTDSISVDHWTPVYLDIHNHSQRSFVIELFDHFPHGVEAKNAHKLIEVKAKSEGNCSYQINPYQRGDLLFGPIDMLIPSSLGLWRFRFRFQQTSKIKVYPNFSAVAQYAMLSMDQQIAQMGIRLQQRRGEGLEFHQLREFRQGDSLRQIDWNASARIKKLISKEYQEETDQQIIFLLDCGRNMRSRDQQLSHFDHALNAVLLLTHVALKQGDSVGLLTFSGDYRWLKPVKGHQQINTMLHQVYDLKSTQRASDYLTAANTLMAQNSKRSLVIMISNLQDEFEDDIHPAIQLMKKKHLVMLANLEEPFLNEIIDTPIATFDEALGYCGTINYLERKRTIEQSLNQRGIMTTNSLPRDLPVNLINKYFEIKREGLL